MVGPATGITDAGEPGRIGSGPTVWLVTDDAVFRDADPLDLPGMLEAQRETAALTSGTAPTDETLATLADRTRGALGADDPTHHRIRVVAAPTGAPEADRSRGPVISYAWIERRPGDTAFLVDFHVAEPQRGSGLAGALFDEMSAVATAWGCRVIEFRVGRSNHRALRFFRRRGATFHPTDEAERSPLAGILAIDGPDRRSA